MLPSVPIAGTSRVSRASSDSAAGFRRIVVVFGLDEFLNQLMVFPWLAFAGRVSAGRRRLRGVGEKPESNCGDYFGGTCGRAKAGRRLVNARRPPRGHLRGGRRV